MSFDDNFSQQASEYARYRPVYPDELYAWIASIAPARAVAWDAGTGNGQAALGLAGHFDRVIATDPSSAQIALATPHERVEYMIAPAEKTEIPDSSVDAVTAASAAHWFDLERFYAEARRVVRPGGVIALWCYWRARTDDATEEIIMHFSDKIVGPYWSPKIALVSKRYSTLPFPFEEIEPPPFAIDLEWSAEEIMGYLRSWSATQAFIEDRGYDPLVEIADDLRAAWGAGRRAVHMDLFMRAGRVTP